MKPALIVLGTVVSFTFSTIAVNADELARRLFESANAYFYVYSQHCAQPKSAAKYMYWRSAMWPIQH